MCEIVAENVRLGCCLPKAVKVSRMKNALFRVASALPKPAMAFVLARFVSSLGSAVTAFALNVWIYQQTGSYALFASFAVVAMLPNLLLSPFAGVLVDRMPHKRLLLACEAVAACAVILIYIMNATGVWSTTLIGFAILVLSMVRTVTWPATGAVVTYLTTAQERPRVNGLAEALDGVISVTSPILGAMLFELAQVRGVIALNLLSYAVCILVFAQLPFPTRKIDNADPRHAAGSPLTRLRNDCAFGFQWIAARKEMVRLLAFFSLFNFGCAAFGVAFPPYILSFSSTEFLGWCTACVGAGALTGGALFATTGGMKHHFTGMLFGAAIMAPTMVAFGLVRTGPWLLSLAFVYGAGYSFLSASSQTIWQSRVPANQQGRVFAVRRMIAWALNPVAIVLTIPLSNLVFGPVVQKASAVSATDFASFWGTEQAGTLGLMMSACGVLCCTVVVTMSIIYRVRADRLAVPSEG
jgi:DHA3 family macrolide efflux protein-like MFS transporter